VTLAGVLSQWPSIQAQLQRGASEIANQLAAFGVDAGAVNSVLRELREVSETATAGGNPLTTGMLSSVGTAIGAGLSGTVSFLFGLFIAATLLYYVLTDWPTVSGWLGRNMAGLPPEIGEGIVSDAVSAMRGYFRANTISGLVVAFVIGALMVLMGIHLAAPVALVTFLTTYIPFFGAILSGAFGFIVALGSSGLTEALVLLVIILVAQNVLQTVINTKLMGESLNLHPLVVLGATMLGGIFGGLLGAALGAPIAALLVNVGKRLSVAFGPAEMPAEEPA
jgi:predicted PurR-regulated permease PerM